MLTREKALQIILESGVDDLTKATVAKVVKDVPFNPIEKFGNDLAKLKNAVDFNLELIEFGNWKRQKGLL